MENKIICNPWTGYYIVIAIKIGLGIGAVTDIILIQGSRKNQTRAIYLWCIVNFFYGICLYPLVAKPAINEINQLLRQNDVEEIGRSPPF